MRDYEYNGFIPYGAGEMFCLDYYVELNFTGNVVEQIIADGIGQFEVKDEGTAFLKLPTMDILFRKDEAK